MISMAIATVKLITLGIKLLIFAAYLVRRADYADSPNEHLVHQNIHAQIFEQRAKFGWPVQAMLRFTTTERWLIELSAQGRFHLSSELTIGIPELDKRFFVAPESERFCALLRSSPDLSTQLLRLQSVFDRHGARFSRLSCEQRQLDLGCNVRWVRDRAKLYREIAIWFDGFDLVLRSALASRSVARHKHHSTA